MVRKLKVEGIEAFNKTVVELGSVELYVLFSGSKDSSGQSWCPDCVAGTSLISSSIFLY